MIIIIIYITITTLNFYNQEIGFYTLEIQKQRWKERGMMDRWFLPRLPRAGRTTSTLLFAIFTHVKLGQKQWSFNTYKSSVNTYHSVRTFHGKLEKISSIAPRRRWSAVLLDTAHNTQTSTKHKQSPVTASKKQHHTKQHTFVLAKVEHVTEYTTWSEPHDPQQNRVGGSLNKKGAWIANFSQASSYNSYAFDWDFWVLGHIEMLPEI